MQETPLTAQDRRHREVFALALQSRDPVKLQPALLSLSVLNREP
jgi:hypothetical protein